jgi:hypothetical protein
MPLFAEDDVYCPRCGKAVSFDSGGAAQPDPSAAVPPPGPFAPADPLDEPTADSPAESPPDAAPIPQGEACGAPAATPPSRCTACGHGFAGLRLYDPKHFVWLGVVFCALVPLFMSASNWGKLGKTKTKWRCLGAGFMGFTALFTILTLFGNTGKGRGNLGLNLLLNVPVALLLRDRQRPLYDAALRLGAERATIVKGLLAGLGLVVGAIVLSLSGLTAFAALEFRLGVGLMNEQKYAEAAARFEHLLDWNPDADGALFDLSFCHVMQKHWEEGGRGFERYLKREPNNPAAIAYLAYVRYRQGRYAEANALMARARAIDPHIFEKLFSPGYELPGPPRSARLPTRPGAGSHSSVLAEALGGRQSREKRMVMVAVTSLGTNSGARVSRRAACHQGSFQRGRSIGSSSAARIDPRSG